MNDPNPATPPSDVARDKTERPHAHFEQASEIVVDPTLSKDEKLKALDAMEQDARQLAAASAEGMGGGETARLGEVLAARTALDLPPADIALAVVTLNLKARLASTEGTEAHALIVQTLDAMEQMSVAIPDMPHPAARPAVETKPEDPKDKPK